MTHLRTRLALASTALTLALVPITTNAAKSFKDIVNGSIVPMGNAVIQLLYAIAFVVFLVGMFQYFFVTEGNEGRQKGRQLMLWGVIGLAILFAVWGLVRILLEVLTTWTA